MGLFKDERFDYLDEERQKIWAKVTALEEQSRHLQEESRTLKDQSRLLEEALAKKTSDYELEAKEASERAFTFATDGKAALDVISAVHLEGNSKLEEIRTVLQTVSKMQPEIYEFHVNAQKNEESIEQIRSNVDALHNSVTQKVNELNTIYSNHATYVEKVSKLEELYTTGNDYTVKIEQFHKTVLGKSEQINKLHLSIAGYVGKDDKGEEVKVPGLKDQLENEYNVLSTQADKLQQKVADIELSTESQYSVYRQTKEDEYKTTLLNWGIEHDAIVKRIRDLLPEALTAGLSAAYHDKKEAEIEASRVLTVKFLVGIFGMILVSLIPFLVSVYFLKTGKTMEQVITDIPRMALAILPLYIPVLWLAYSANKSQNLSKRLIEEYTHKEVLSKTFEGLSRQIENIQDEEISSELRIKLLYNILEVNSENPGKLITDYNKSDHPLMDALDKSVKLGHTIDKIAEIPGLTKLSAMLEKKAKRMLEEKKKQAKAGLESVSEEGEDEEESEEKGKGKSK